MAAKDPAVRQQIARMGALGMLAKNDPSETSKRGRAAFLASFERQADPEGILKPEERARRADALLRLHMERLSLKARQARAKRGFSEDQTAGTP